MRGAVAIRPTEFEGFVAVLRQDGRLKKMTLATAVTLDALRIMPVVEPKPALYIE